MRISSPLRIEKPETNHKPSQRHSTWCTAGLHRPPGSSRARFEGAPPLLFGSAFPLFAFPSLHHYVSGSPCSFRRQLAVEHTFIMERYIISPSSLSSDRLANTTHNVGFSSSVRIDSQSLASDESRSGLAVWVERRGPSTGGGGCGGCRRGDDGGVSCVLFDARGGQGSGEEGGGSRGEGCRKLFSRAERDYGAGATLPSAASIPSRARRRTREDTFVERSENHSAEREHHQREEREPSSEARMPSTRARTLE